MRWLRSVVREVVGLFVDDGSFALAIVVWLALGAWVLPRLAGPAGWTGPALFGGLAAILIVSAVRFGRQK